MKCMRIFDQAPIEWHLPSMCSSLLDQAWSILGMYVVFVCQTCNGLDWGPLTILLH